MASKVQAPQGPRSQGQEPRAKQQVPSPSPARSPKAPSPEEPSPLPQHPAGRYWLITGCWLPTRCAPTQPAPAPDPAHSLRSLRSRLLSLKFLSPFVPPPPSSLLPFPFPLPNLLTFSHPTTIHLQQTPNDDGLLPPQISALPTAEIFPSSPSTHCIARSSIVSASICTRLHPRPTASISRDAHPSTPAAFSNSSLCTRSDRLHLPTLVLQVSLPPYFLSCPVCLPMHSFVSCLFCPLAVFLHAGFFCCLGTACSVDRFPHVDLRRSLPCGVARLPTALRKPSFLRATHLPLSLSTPSSSFIPSFTAPPLRSCDLN
ncbi:hypothetical protein BGZ61DRAFT_185488 [Ilyonectria robusta]|uniref:uncharacterized protein n=1 Tax=Ilyonectria robusta TaxID=1079257 RepID=UPI001E8EE5D2|nr:uncharacterized protein BGZ61DRAFT_185488 [Ilyonectria robusta]KAH8729639.1 hypothetical protein BGZ61DRAFT_185488 [Ilyonectria robusta]